mmetsp:Transcript_28849/g.65667  ORF Transcript_28849/g.65667 Transcript_28849/m.65667 type:complete len:206 (-) Transcript_28849:400-1017(-)
MRNPVFFYRSHYTKQEIATNPNRSVIDWTDFGAIKLDDVDPSCFAVFHWHKRAIVVSQPCMARLGTPRLAVEQVLGRVVRQCVDFASLDQKPAALGSVREAHGVSPPPVGVERTRRARVVEWIEKVRRRKARVEQKMCRGDGAAGVAETLDLLDVEYPTHHGIIVIARGCHQLLLLTGPVAVNSFTGRKEENATHHRARHELRGK